MRNQIHANLLKNRLPPNFVHAKYDTFTVHVYVYYHFDIQLSYWIHVNSWGPILFMDCQFLLIVNFFEVYLDVFHGFASMNYE